MIFEQLLFALFCLSFYYLYKNNPKCWKKRDKNGNLPPGPWGIPIFGYLPFLGKVPYIKIIKLSKIFGKMVTLKLGNYNVVFVNDFDTIKEMYKLDNLTGRFQMNVFEKRGKFGLGLLEGKEWQEVRRFLLKCLRDFGFGKRSMETSVMEEVLQARDKIRQNTDKPIYIKPMVELFVINALWGMMVGEKFDIDDPLNLEVVHILSDGIANQNLVGVGAFIPIFAKLFPNLSGYTKGMKYFGPPEEMTRNVLKKHIETYVMGEERDFVDVALTKIYNTTDMKSMFYKETGMRNLFYTIIDMLFAGSDTLSSTLGWSFLYLAMWPEIQDKVHEEIDKVIGNSRLPSTEDRAKMVYTEATMAEVLRRSAMVPLGLFHATTEDFVFGGFDFPKGTLFLANLFHVLRDPVYWGDPEEFRPDRFITLDGTFRKDERLIAFFTGKRTCPGESLAMVEYFLFFTGIMQKFKFSLDPSRPRPDIGPKPGFILPPPSNDLLIVTERK